MEILPISIWEAALISVVSGSVFVLLASFGSFNSSAGIVFSWVLLVRIVLEIIQVYATYNALRYADLSSFNFVRGFSVVFTIIIEVILIGTVLSYTKYLGIILIVLSIAIVFRHGMKNINGIGYLLISTLNGGVLNAIAKYQYLLGQPYVVESIVRVTLIIVLLIIVIYSNRKTMGSVTDKVKSNYKLLSVFPLRSAASFLSVTAIKLGSASVYTIAERGGSVVFGVLLGHHIFKEKGNFEKYAVAFGIVVGLALISLG